MTYDCGCINELDADSGVLTSIVKCEFHQEYSRTHPQGDSVEYFKAMGCFDERGIPNNNSYIAEFAEGLSRDDLDYLCWGKDKTLLELGPGLGPYVPFFLGHAWRYEAIESAPFAVKWVNGTFCVPVHWWRVEDYLASEEIAPVDCIFAAHLLEHVKDAPGLLRLCFQKTKEKLYLIVPDDSDPTNPDHLWFFTQKTLHALLEKTGFKNPRSTIYKRVPQENFIYCVAEKP